MVIKEEASSSEEYVGYAKDIGLAAGTELAVVLVRFIQIALLTKWLGASLYGSWALILVTVSILTQLAILGLNMAVVRFLAAAKEVDKIREGFLAAVFTILAAGVSVALILVLCSDFFASSIIRNINSSDLVKLASFLILTQALSDISRTFFRTFRRLKWYAALLIAKVIIELGLMACFLLLGWGLRGLIVAILVSGALPTAVALFVALRQIGFQLPKFTEIKSYLKYGLPLIPHDAMLWIMLFSNRYIIGYFMGVKDVGIYTAACALTNTIYHLIFPLGIVLLPTISKSYDNGDIAKTKTYLTYSLKYLMALSIPAAFGLFILAAPLLGILTTPEFTSGSLVVPLIALGLVMFGFYQVGLHVFHLVKKTYLIVRLLGIAAALNIGLNLLLIPRMGILGAAVASLVAYAILAVLTLIFSSRYFAFSLDFSFIMKSVLASAIMAVAIWLLNPLGITEVIISILLGVVIYSGIIFALRGFSKNELRLLRDLVAGIRILPG